MPRLYEPRFFATDEMGKVERDTLTRFLDTLHEHARQTAEVIRRYTDPDELISDARKIKRDDDSVDSQILRTAGPLFELRVDMAAEVDPETAKLMRQEAIARSKRGETVKQGRLGRMALFATEVANWQEERVEPETSPSPNPYAGADPSPLQQIRDALLVPPPAAGSCGPPQV